MAASCRDDVSGSTCRPISGVPGHDVSGVVEVASGQPAVVAAADQLMAACLAGPRGGCPGATGVSHSPQCRGGGWPDEWESLRPSCHGKTETAV